MNRVLLFLLLNAIVMVASAQNRQVFGQVIDASNDEPLIGATIMPVGKGNGTVTDIDGNFTLNIAHDVKSLKFTYIGMEPLVSEVEFGKKMTVRMKSSENKLDEVIVVAYGTTTKGAFTGSASVVNAAELEDRLVTDVTKALAGTVAGVQIQSASGQPGTEPVVRIQGVGSINAGMDPLYVVDGIPYDGGMRSINPQDVESITVLKDAASAALYGARGANGVILVTTRKGCAGRRKVTFDARWGINSRQVPRYDVITSPEAYVMAIYNARRNYALSRGVDADVAYRFAVDGNSKDPGLNGGPGNNALGYQMWNIPEGESLILPDGSFNPNATLGYSDGEHYFMPDNWQKESYRNGFRQEYNLSVQGGNDNGTYMISGSYLDDEGSIVKSKFQRMSVRATGEYDIYRWLKVGANMLYTYEDSNNPSGQTKSGFSNNVTYMADYIAPIYPMYLRNAGGEIMREETTGRPLYDYGMKGLGLPYSRSFLAGGNPTGSLAYDKSEYLYDVFNGKWFAQIKPLEGLTITGTLGFYLSNMRYNYFANGKYGQSSNYGGAITQQTGRNRSLNIQWLANYRKTFGEKHNTDFLLGYEEYSLNITGIWGSGRNVYSNYNYTLSNIIDNKDLGGEDDSYATRGIFGRANYNFDNRYFASVSYRRDASSRFAKNHRWGNFWSLSAAWDISNEKFFEEFVNIDQLKYKISFGQQGNDQMAQAGIINNYPYIDQYNQGGANGIWSVGTLYFKGNPNLTWETSNSFNTGFDFSFWHGKLTGSLEYFSRQTDDMLFFKPTGLSSGYSSIPMNIGSMRNYGMELDINYRPISTANITCDINLNMTLIKNKILKLAPELKGRWQAGSQIFEEGKSRYQLYLVKYAGVDPENGSSLWWGRHADGTEFKTDDFNLAYSGDEATSDVANRQATGNLLPPVYGGFGTSLSAYGFDFSVQFAYQLGGKIMDSGYQQLMNGGYQQERGSALHKDMLAAWTPSNPSASIPRLDWGAQYANASSDRWLTSSDYLSLNNISVGYTLPSKLTSRIGIESVRIYGAADNVALWSKRKGMDPRQSYIQSYAGYYAALRTISGGLKVTF